MVAEKLVLLSLCLLALSGSFCTAELAAINQNLTEIEGDTSAQTYMMRYEDVKASELIRYISKLANRNFVYSDVDLDFKVTYISDEPESIDTILNVFIEILHINELDVHEQGETFLVTAAGSMNKPSRVVGDQVPVTRVEPGMITKVFSLKYADPNSVKKTLSSLVGKSTVIENLENSRCLIVVDSTANVERIESLIEHIDTDDGDVQLRTYTAKHLNLNALQALTLEITGPMIGSEKQTIIPNPMTESLYIVASPLAMKKTLGILEMLDVRSEKEAGELERLLQSQSHPDFHLHKLQFHGGSEILDALKKVGKILADNDGSDPKLGYAIDTMQWIETSNSLLFSGNPSSIQKLKGLIAMLDTPVKQVFIEVLIIETNLTNNLSFGVDLGGTWLNNNSKTGFSVARQQGTGLSGLPTSFPSSVSATAPSLESSGTLGIGVLGNRLIHKGNVFLSLGALTRALQSDGNTQVIMNPRIVTEDNNPCEFFTGQTVRYDTGAQQATGASSVISNTYSTMDIGSTLRIQPTISGSDIISMRIEQSYSTAGATDSTKKDLTPLSNSTTTTTRVHVPNKFFLILGGMSSHTSKQNKTMVPCLGAIPIFGKLVSDTENSDTRQNLLIFVRPHIIDSYEEARDLMARSQDELRRDFQLPKSFGKEVNRAMVRGQMIQPESIVAKSEPVQVLAPHKKGRGRTAKKRAVSPEKPNPDVEKVTKVAS